VHPIRCAPTKLSTFLRTATTQQEPSDYPTTTPNKRLLPHTDHAFYSNPIQVLGFYGVEGSTENTSVSTLAVLETQKSESPDLYSQLSRARLALIVVSRVSTVMRYIKAPYPAVNHDTPTATITCQACALGCRSSRAACMMISNRQGSRMGSFRRW
jgi:hypothetical protein